MSIGTRWRQARENAGLSAAKAAIVAGVHENTIYLLENDRKNDGVTVRLCRRVADAYGVPLGEIFRDDQGERPVRVPPELRPLHEFLQPLDVEARLSFVRNVVANARFMAHLVAVGDGDHAPAGMAGYTAASTSTDEPASGEEVAVGAGFVTSEHVKPSASQTTEGSAAEAKRR